MGSHSHSNGFSGSTNSKQGCRGSRLRRKEYMKKDKRERIHIHYDIFVVAVNPCQSPPYAPPTKPCRGATTVLHDRRRGCCHRMEDLGRGSPVYLNLYQGRGKRYVCTPTNRHLAYGHDNFLKFASKPQKIAVTYSERIKNGIFCIIRGTENIGIPDISVQ